MWNSLISGRRRLVFGQVAMIAILAVAGCHPKAPAAVRPAAAEPGVDWLRERSMLLGGAELSRTLEGTGEQWQHPYGRSQPGAFLDLASVWFNAYPASLITRKGESVLETLGDPNFLQALRQVGVEAIHTGPLKRAGSVDNERYGPTVDGYFDRIELAVDPAFGSDAQYRDMVKAARASGITIIGDIVPGHTGKGPDFRLAELGAPGFAGLYTMTEIPRDGWSLLPDVPAGADSVNLSRETAQLLAERGYIIGPLDTVIFARPGIKESNWSATGVVRGVDGRERRWVYLHLFKAGQPTLNWLDPGFGAERLVAGDVLHSLRVLGARGLRLDANMFLGVERRPGDEPGWLLEHPLSTVATEILAMLIRKMGGFSFQELNASLDRIAATLTSGPELAYDFVTRPVYLFALATGDAGPLRLMLRQMVEHHLPSGRMVHALQNHDELMLEETPLRVRGTEVFEYEGARDTGAALFGRIPHDVEALTTGTRGPYNEVFAMSPGVCSTLAGFTAASLGIADLAHLTPPEVEEIRRRHLAAAAYNALQPGAFVVSGWDLVGALPLSRDAVRDRLGDNDCRWLNRGAYDLAGLDPGASASEAGLPKAVSLYGSIPDQLRDPASFASRLRDLLAVRKQLDLSRARLLAVPEVASAGLALLLLELPSPADDAHRYAVSAINFGRDAISQRIDDDRLRAGRARIVFSTVAGRLDRAADTSGGRVLVRLAPSEAQMLVVN
jgi:trehalose synthase